MIRKKLFTLFLPLTFLYSNNDVVLHENLFRMSYENIQLPNKEDMGLLGLSYLRNFDNDFYVGPSLYGSIAGNRGGFFTAGIDAGYKLPIFDDTFKLDLGLFLGGGGGASAPQGGGLMVRPHFGVLFNKRDYQLGLNFSHIEFPNGDISSNQISFQIDFPFHTIYTNTTNSSKIYDGLSSFYLNDYNFAWINNYFTFNIQQYIPKSGSTDTSGIIDEELISLVGIEYGRYLNPKLFGFLEGAGAFSGGAGGYMEILAGLGYDYPLNDYLGLKAKASLGSAGGGNVDTGGGFVYKGSVGAYVKTSKNLSFNAEIGLVDAPTGNFSALSTKISMSYNFDLLGLSNNFGSIEKFKNITPEKWDLRLVNQRYFSSENNRTTGNDKPIDLIGFKFDRYLNDNLYLTGQTSWAYEGDSGGYATGLLGVGYKSPYFFENLSVYVETTIGAGAGGSVATEGGAIIQPMVGLTYEISESLDFQVGAGMIKAFQGDLDTTVMDFGLIYKFNSIEK